MSSSLLARDPARPASSCTASPISSAFGGRTRRASWRWSTTATPATEIRRRLFDLLGEDARGVTVSTCHGLAMRLVGASFAGQAGDIAKGEFDKILKQAIALLKRRWAHP